MITPRLKDLHEALIAAQGDTDALLTENTRAAVRGALVALSRELGLPCPVKTRRERRQERYFRPD